MLYGIYKESRNAAWQCLIDYNIKKLPVSTLAIARSAGISVKKNSETGELLPSERGVSILDGEQWYIIYDDDSTPQQCRFTIAHELGHIFLGHELKKGYHARTFDIEKPQVESEADVFASRLLAPACVLWALGVRTPEEITALCNISPSAARFRAKRMAVLYERNKFLTHPLERQVYKNFEEFIKK